MRTTNLPTTTDDRFAWFQESQDIREVTEDLCRRLDRRQSHALTTRGHMSTDDIDKAIAHASTAVGQVAIRQRQREAIRATSARFTRKFDEAVWRAIHDDGETVESLSEQLVIPRRTIDNALRSHNCAPNRDQLKDKEAPNDEHLNLLDATHWRDQSHDHMAEIVRNIEASAKDLRDMVDDLETIDNTQETIDRLDHARILLRQAIGELDISPQQ